MVSKDTFVKGLEVVAHGIMKIWSINWNNVGLPGCKKCPWVFEQRLFDLILENGQKPLKW